MRFGKIILIGAGKVATDCTRFLCRDLKIGEVEIIESSENQFSMLERTSAKMGVPYRRLQTKGDITDILLENAQKERLLVISANNRYLFPAKLCAKSNVEIINFHYGYLPSYRGMNIPTWVIYNREPFTGVTWHYVTAEVDRGEIIAQKKIALHNDITAYDVVRNGMQIGVELFMGFILELLERRIPGKEITTSETIYFDKQLPQDGKVNLEASVVDIYRLLRSFDYGRTGTLPPLKIDLEGKTRIVVDYHLSDGERTESRVQQVEDELIISELGKRLRIKIV